MGWEFNLLRLLHLEPKYEQPLIPELQDSFGRCSIPLNFLLMYPAQCFDPTLNSCVRHIFLIANLLSRTRLRVRIL
jgi:hypothetical protein